MEYVPIFWDIETTGLHPMAEKWWNNTEHSAQVVCVGIGTVQNWGGNIDGVFQDVEVIFDDEEYELLNKVRSHMERILPEIEGWHNTDGRTSPAHRDKSAFLVGWNNRKFDHPYYSARCGRLRLDPFPFGHSRKRLDGMRAMKKHRGQRKNIKQDDVAEELGVKSRDEITGKDVPDYFGRGNIAPIIKHCKTDLEDLIQVFLHYRKPMMRQFYSHYDIDMEPNFVDSVDL